MSEERIVVITTVSTVQDAERIARLLVERRLAACVNVLPAVGSVYRWKGSVLRESEIPLLVKTRRDVFETLREALVAAHPYDLPEIIALPIVAGHGPYLAWMDDSVVEAEEG